MRALDDTHWQDLIGLPFRDRARGPEAYDCFGLMLEVYRRRGLEIADADYSVARADRAARLLERLTAWRPCALGPGAALLFREEGVPGHVGIALDDDRFLHAAQSLGQVGIGFLSRGWKHRLLGAYEPIQD